MERSGWIDVWFLDRFYDILLQFDERSNFYRIFDDLGLNLCHFWKIDIWKDGKNSGLPNELPKIIYIFFIVCLVCVNDLRECKNLMVCELNSSTGCWNRKTRSKCKLSPLFLRAPSGYKNKQSVTDWKENVCFVKWLYNYIKILI